MGNGNEYFLALIEHKGKQVRCAYAPKTRKAHMLDKNDEVLEKFTYSKFKFIGYLETSKQAEKNTFKE